MNRCPYVSRVMYDNQRNALRVEILAHAEYCSLQTKPGAERLMPARWVLSGGSPIAVYEPCNVGADTDKCRLWQEGECGGWYLDNKSAPCPRCRQINWATFPSDERNHVAVTCRGCGLEYVLYDFSFLGREW